MFELYLSASLIAEIDSVSSRLFSYNNELTHL